MNYRDSRRRREAESVENIFEDITAENFPNPGNIHVQEAESPKQNQPKEEHTKIYYN